MSSNKNELSFFPSTKSEALAMLYLQTQNLTNISPKEFAKKYEEIYSEISSFYTTQTQDNSESMVDFFAKVNSSIANHDILNSSY